MVLASEPEFEQARNELASCIAPFLEKHPEYATAFEIVQVPERVIQFRVVWEDDQGKPHVQRGYRVQFNSSLGPYKGGLRLHPTVNLSILKFLGFEQIFKNALTGINMGGGKGGSDFDPKGKSDNEIRRFCYAFMQELSRHIGADTDVPAGDIGTGGREIGFLFGAYKKLRNEWVGVLTGKGPTWGGSFTRPEATGYGLIYYCQEMIPYLNPTNSSSGISFSNPETKVLISGSGNVAQYAALKVLELGAKVMSLSDSKGALIACDDKGFTKEDIEKIAALKLKQGVLDAVVRDGLEWHAGKRPWTLVAQADIALPCATQNEVSEEEAHALLKAGVRLVAEGSNMGCTQEAIDVFEASRRAGGESAVWYAPGKASNCGGVAVSGLEMAQNSARLQWTTEEVDDKLKGIMQRCFATTYKVGAEYSVEQGSSVLPSLVVGANIAGFKKVADAMREHGDWW
ncbi:probable NADP-specific glutamate dehydrogenase [Serendipita indica DSM 11827]|uniref:Glutamate dehydrogenase n=1 Tax=Serendipita indica (strain DSM 11827) TaxID=1109443 RepID=G4TLD3_SERID|nr:probable NADP-specific glutamate dehydrogenase [Serendipita indica DSM 11827]